MTLNAFSRAGLVACALTAVACAAPAARSPAHEMPFRMERNQILLEARVREQGPFTFLLDTGVTPSAIDVDTGRSLGLTFDAANAQQAAGAGGARVTIYPTRIDDLELSGVDYGGVDAVAFPMAGLSARMGEPLHGILGDSFLNQRVVTIDYGRRVVTIGGDVPDAAAPGVYQFPLVTAPNDIMPLMQVRVNGRALTVSMDTGSSFGLEVFESALADAGLTETVAGWEAGGAEGARGAFETRVGVLPRVEIGPFVLEEVGGVATARENEQYRQGNAGNELFEHFVVTFDYVGRTVTLVRAGQLE